MLRLVHPRKEGKLPARRKFTRTGFLSPTREERQRIHAALRNIARAYGGWDVLAAVIGVHQDTLQRAKKQASFAIAVLAARAAGIPVEQLLSGQPHVAGTCVVCGRKGAR